MPISKKRYPVAYFHTDDGAIRIAEPAADYICELEDEVTKRNTLVAQLRAIIVQMEKRSLWERITNKEVE